MNILKKIIRIFNFFKFIDYKINFSNPPLSKVLIMEKIKEQHLKECVLEDIDYDVLETRGFIYNKNYKKTRDLREPHLSVLQSLNKANLPPTKVFLSFKMIYFICYFFFYKKVSSLVECYIYAYLSIAKPLVVLDVVKNLSLVYGAKFFPKITFKVLIDNLVNKLDTSIHGFENNQYQDIFKLYLSKNRNLKFNNLHIYCMGQKDVDQLSDCNISEKENGIKVHPIGSLLADYATRKFGRNTEKYYDIVFISSLSHNLDPYDKQYEVLIDSTKILLKYLSKYLHKKKELTCLVQLRGFQNEENKVRAEEKLCREYLQNNKNISFKRREHLVADSYFSVLKSSLAVTVNSNLGFETMALNRKVLFTFFDFVKYYKWTSNKITSDSLMWDWILVEKNYDKFEIMMNELIKMNSEEYLKKTNQKADYIVKINKKDDAGFLLNKDIKKIIYA